MLRLLGSIVLPFGIKKAFLAGQIESRYCALLVSLFFFCVFFLLIYCSIICTNLWKLNVTHASRVFVCFCKAYSLAWADILRTHHLIFESFPEDPRKLFRRYIKHSRQCFIGYIQTPRISLKMLRCASYFQLFSSVFGYPDETLSLVSCPL